MHDILLPALQSCFLLLLRHRETAPTFPQARKCGHCHGERMPINLILHKDILNTHFLTYALYDCIAFVPDRPVVCEFSDHIFESDPVEYRLQKVRAMNLYIERIEVVDNWTR